MTYQITTLNLRPGFVGIVLTGQNQAGKSVVSKTIVRASELDRSLADLRKNLAAGGAVETA